MLVALLTPWITPAHASLAPTITSNPTGLSSTAAPLRHDAESPLRVPHVRANARRLGAPGARSAASTHGPYIAATTPRGRHRLQNFVTGATTESFAYDALLRTTEFRRNGATVEVYLRDDLSDNIAAVSNGTPGLAGLRRRIIWDGVDHPLWMFDADRGVTVYFELDTTGNVRRLHAGERVTGLGAFSGDLGGYSYTAFGRNIPTTEPGGLATPKIDGVDYFQRLQWQGRWLYNRSGGLYDFRARFWSPQLGAFLQLDRYQFLSSGGTLWSWPGQNPFRYGDPSGRDAEEWFLRNGNDIADGLMLGSNILLTAATLGAGLEVAAAIAEGRLLLGAALRLGAAGAAKGALLGGAIEAARQGLTTNCPPDAGKIAGAAFDGAVAGAVFGARGGIGGLGAGSGPGPGGNPTIEAKELTGVQANKIIGDTAADELADSLRQAGLTVEREVAYQTPVGTRVADLRVSGPDGAVRGLVEVKVGGSPYTVLQRLKDFFIQSTHGHPTHVVRY